MLTLGVLNHLCSIGNFEWLGDPEIPLICVLLRKMYLPPYLDEHKDVSGALKLYKKREAKRGTATRRSMRRRWRTS